MWEIIFKTSNVFLYPTNKKICRNLVSFSHSILAIILISLNVKYKFIILNSGSYFVWDIVHMLEHDIIDPFYVYHHLVALMFLVSSCDVDFIQNIILNAEISNLPTYWVYHKLKLNKCCEFAKKTQLVWFFYFRLIVFTKYIYLYYEKNFIMNNLLAVYFLGIYWFFNQFLKVFPSPLLGA